MKLPINTLAAMAAAAVLATPILAQQSEGARLSAECRAEIVTLCGTDRTQMRTCLREKAAELSDTCRTALRERAEARGSQRGGGVDRREQRDGGRGGTDAPATTAPSATPAPQSLSYGNDPLQALNLWVPATAGAAPAPLVLFVHGGGWKRGSKDNATSRVMPGHMLDLGYAFASIDYRLVPGATVEQQAADVATALAHVLDRADSLGIDRSRVVLTGHSAGAHLVALVGTDEQYLRSAGLSFADIDGVMPNDGAAYDVPLQMAQSGRIMAKTYEQAFGTDAVRQQALSPTHRAAAPNAPAFLLLHVQREDGVAQNNALAQALKSGGTQVEIASLPGKGLRGHMEINRRLGQPDYPATAVMDAWLKRVLG